MPEHSAIDLIGLVNANEVIVFDKVEEFSAWVEANPEAQFVGHNLKFDFRHLRQWGAPLRKDHFFGDTLLMAHVHKRKIHHNWLEDYETRRLAANAAGGKHREVGKLSLKVCAPYYVGTEELWEGATYNDVTYVAKDCFYTLLLYCYFLQTLNVTEYQFYHNKQLPWTWMLLQAEERGVKLDLERLNELELNKNTQQASLSVLIKEQWADANARWAALQRAEVIEKYEGMKRIRGWEQRLQRALDKAPTELNLDSPKQMSWLLKEYKGLNIENYVGKESTGKEVLQRLADDGHEDIARYLEYRKVHKILTAFIPSYRALIDDQSTIHTSFHSAGTRTGRLSSSDPNLQQVSKELKHLFVPRPGYKFVCLDLSAIEAQLIAWYADDEALCTILLNDWSIHDFNVKEVFFDVDCDISEVKTKYAIERKAAKTVGFALFYGAGPARIKAAFTAAGFPITVEQAKFYHERFKQRYSQAVRFHRDITQAFEMNETVLNALGRPINLQEDENPYMQGFNTLVQSSASDINLDAAYRTQEQWEREGVDAYIVLLIHDAIVAEVKEEIAEKALKDLKNNMERFKLNTKFGTFSTKTEGGITDEWE